MGDTLARGNNLFALNLHKTLAKDQQNVFFSPFSVSTVLSMLLYGTRGIAADELKEALGLTDVDNEALPGLFQQLLSSIEAAADDYTVSYGNSVVLQKDFDVRDEYVSTLKTSFGALCQQADFAKDAAAAVQLINNWVKEKTREKIPKLLDSLDTDTVMVLLNAVYFKGSWLRQFQEKATFMQYFYNEGLEDNAQLVEMMHLKEKFNVMDGESFKAMEMPYKGEGVAMMVLLPNSREGLLELESSLSPDFVQDCTSKMRKVKLEVALPKFKLEHSVDLGVPLMDIGVGEVFKVGADFGGISGCKNLALSKVVHKAALEVNEEGCEAAAATAAMVMCRSMKMTPEFIVDHPFLLVIYDTKNDLILFMGRVVHL